MLIKKSSKPNQTITVSFTYGDENEVHNDTDYILPLPNLTFTPTSNLSQTVEISALKVGHLVVGAQSNQTEM